MKNLVRNTGKAVSAVLAAAMLFQATALAAPVDELDEILERQSGMQEESLLEKTIGFSEMGKAIADNGLQVRLECGVDEETARMMGLDTVPLGGHVTLNVQVDPKLEKWLFKQGIGTEDGSVIDVSLYGDKERFALMIPQFFAGAISLHAGNFRDQYLNSDLAQIIGETENIPDIDMKFYPEESDIADTAGPFDGLQEQIEEKFEQIAQDMQVEKSEKDGLTVYTAAVETSDIMDVYRMFMDSYISVFEDFVDSGVVTVGDSSGLDAEVDQMLDAMESMLGDEVAVDFTVKDGLVEKIGYDLYIDTTEFVEASEVDAETVLTESTEETLAEAGDASDASAAIPESGNEAFHVSVEAEEFRGHCRYEIVYADPADPLQAFAVNMTVTDDDGDDSAAMSMTKETQTTDTVSETVIGLEMTENGETLYSGDLIHVRFDSETGDLDASLEMTDPDTNEEVALRLDSTFSEIEKGKSFLWTIDSVSVETQGQSAGIAAEIRISAEPGEIVTPQSERVLFDMTQAELLALVSEISANAEIWSAQFEPETEIPEDTTVESEASEAIAMIGGADGPTSVFIAGKVG